MAIKKLALCLVAAVVFCGGLITERSEAVWRDGKWINTHPYRIFTTRGVNRRPFSAFEKGMPLGDYRIYNLPINEKGMNIGATRLSNGTAWAYRWISIWHCEITDAWRSGPGWHTDFIRIYGGGDHRQDVPTHVVLTDINIHRGDALPLIIQDGWFDKIELKDIRIADVTVSAQIVAINSGHIGDVYIENCPGLRLALCGRPGSIQRVFIRNSPGASISDTLTKNGRSGARIIYLP